VKQPNWILLLFERSEESGDEIGRIKKKNELQINKKTIKELEKQ
jgi:hypothetical protein